MNKEIALFIRMLFNRKRNLGTVADSSVFINYFTDLECAKSYLLSLDKSEWEVLGFTPSQYDLEHHEAYSDPDNKTSHAVIGQEFDGVAVVIDEYFKYHIDGPLLYSGRTYYHALRMLFQNVTRIRKRLNIVIINNEDLLRRCIEIVKS